MGSFVPLLSDRVQINRVLILVGSTVISIIGFINNRIHPEIEDPFVLRLGFTILSYLVVALSYFTSFGKKNFIFLCNVLYFLLVILFQYINVTAQFHPVYIFGSYLVFLGISLGINNLFHLRVYLLFYFFASLCSVLIIRNPLYPGFNHLFQLLVLSILIYVLISSYLGFQKILEISNEHFKTLINSADQLYFLIDEDFKLLKINQKGKDFVSLKYELGIEEGEDITKFFSLQELNFLINNSNRAFNGATIILERLISLPNNSKWYEIKFIPVRDNSDKTKVLISALDITDKKRILDNLKESEEKFRVISDNSPLGIYLYDTNGQVNYVNNNFCHITGINKQAFSNGDWTQGIIKGDLAKIKELYESSFNNLSEFNSTVRYHHRGKGIVWTNFRAAPIFFAGQLYGYVATLEDITELKHASDNLKKSERQFRDLFENAPIGMVLCSLDGVVLNINSALLEILGYNRAELTKKDLFMQLIPEKHTHESYVNHLVRNAIQDQFEKSFISSSGQTVFTIITVSVFNDHTGKPLFVLFQITDISSRKENERLLEEKNNELLKINTELDAFVYSAAHDLRAPLTSILGVVNLVRMEILNPELQKYLDLVDISVKKLDNFISDIIDYSRNARTEVKVDEIDANAFFNQCFEDLTYSKEALTISKIVEIEDRLIYTDKRRLQVIMSNLIGNAMRYHDLGKEKKFIKVHSKVVDSYLVIEVEDNGIGIEQKYQAKIFNMFFRASETSKGSGLGLYIVKEAINKLDGEITVESKYGLGSKFFLKIPNRKNDYMQNANQLNTSDNSVNF